MNVPNYIQIESDHSFKDGEIAYRCKQCEKIPTAILCKTCFDTSEHRHCEYTVSIVVRVRHELLFWTTIMPIPDKCEKCIILILIRQSKRRVWAIAIVGSKRAGKKIAFVRPIEII